MKKHFLIASSIVLTIWLLSSNSIGAGLQDILTGAKKLLGTSDALSESDIVAGLKEALQIGTGKAVDLVSATGGYYNNPDIKIPLPESVQKVEDVLRSAGLGSKVDAFELSMNNAAEHAAPQAKSIFWDALKNMQFADAQKILNGPENAATQYFKDQTFGRLQEVFKPIVKNSMGEVGVTRSYQELNAKMQSIPFAGNLSFDLDQYVTDGALNGLFKMLAEEEKKIRTQPAARVTDLLKKVFGKS
jgi:hypothetical protein